MTSERKSTATRALTLLLAINLFNYIDRYVLASVLPTLKHEFLAGDPNQNGKAGLWTTAFLISYMFTAPIFGWLADRFSRWILIGTSVALWSLASGWSGLATSFGVLLCTRLFVGIGEAGYGPAAPTIIADLYPLKTRGRVLAWFYVAIPVGTMHMARLLAPVQPGKIICVGRNYAEHAREQNVEVPEIPLLFLKPPSAVIGPGESIVLPPQSKQVEHEGELAVVISRKGRWIQVEEALEYVLGYTVANDVTARDLQRRDGQWTRGKGFDTFCPLGPWIETELDPADVLVQTRVNGEMRQMASTREMMFPVEQLIAFISSVMTLQPGDIILTGTPAGIGALQAGDAVEVTVEGVGSLTNPVIAGSGK